MWGILLTMAGSLGDEVADSIGKRQIALQKQSIYTMGFLQLFWGMVFFAIIALVRHKTFSFSLQSLPTFTLRAFLEIIQAHISLYAIVHAERSTFSFIRTGTIPLLLLVDIVLGYSLNLTQIIGILIIVITLLLIFSNHAFNKKALGYVIFSTINAAITLSLFKFNITHYNSVVAEQLVITAILVLYFLIVGYIKIKNNPFRGFREPLYIAQSLSEGFSAIFQSFAYQFAPASVITAAKRSSAVLWSALSGRVYFKETNLPLKLFFFFLLTVGVILLAR